MSYISEKLKTVYPNRVIYVDKAAYSLFEGRNLPEFIKHFIMMKFSDEETGEVDEAAVREYLATKMPVNCRNVMMRLMDGEVVNMTTRIYVKTELSAGKVSFSLPDVEINADMYIQSQVLDEHKDDLNDGENWGNISMMYVAPEGKKKGYVLMTSYKAFNPYKNVDFDELIEGRAQFTTEEWIDGLLVVLGYEPESFASQEAKLTMISRMLIAVETNLNVIEFGPKSTGKSYVYNNMSKGIRMMSNRCTRAQLIYNHATKQYGAVKTHDAVLFDEVSTMQFEDRDGELNGFFKVYLEDGKASLARVKIVSECGLGLVGNIALTDKMEPISENYTTCLPDLFCTSAMLDRFHYFIPGWKLGRVNMGQIYNGWTIDKEYFSEYLHYLRSESGYKKIFDEIVECAKDADTRDYKAVSRVATAFCKLLFPHVRDLSELSPEDIEKFKELYDFYCLQPAVKGRATIRRQCHLIDKEFKADFPEFKIRKAEELSMEYPGDLEHIEEI